MHSADSLVTTLFAQTRAAALAGDDDGRWNCVVELQGVGSEAVFRRAVEWCVSPVAMERAIGADVLAQLRENGESISFRERAVPHVAALLRDSDAAVLAAATVALSHLGVRDQLAAVVALATHAVADVRYGVVLALSGNDTPLAIATLIRLSTDDDETVRDWATFGLGSQTDVDTLELRNALAARLEDTNAEARAEAIVGLARVGDARAHVPILEDLRSASVGRLVVQAARDFPSPAFLDALLMLKTWWDVDSELLESAIARCRAIE